MFELAKVIRTTRLNYFISYLDRKAGMEWCSNVVTPRERLFSAKNVAQLRMLELVDFCFGSRAFFKGFPRVPRSPSIQKNEH